jgi:hypothetical protein
VIVAGGDTSGRAAMRVRALPIAGLTVRRSVVPAGALCTAASPQGWMGGEILLKGVRWAVRAYSRQCGSESRRGSNRGARAIYLSTGALSPTPSEAKRTSRIL